MVPGSLALLQGTLVAIIGDRWSLSFGFFLAHACASAWGRPARGGDRALASSLYLVGYYLGPVWVGSHLHPLQGQGDYRGIGARYRAGAG